jgi:hypothetical protein
LDTLDFIEVLSSGDKVTIGFFYEFGTPEEAAAFADLAVRSARALLPYSEIKTAYRLNDMREVIIGDQEKASKITIE